MARKSYIMLGISHNTIKNILTQEAYLLEPNFQQMVPNINEITRV